MPENLEGTPLTFNRGVNRHFLIDSNEISEL